MSTRAVIYARVSTSEQADNYSLASQVTECQRYAAQKKFDVVSELADTASGATLDRPNLHKLRELVRSRMVDAVVVYCVDRLARDAAVYYILKEELKQAEVSLHYVTKGEVVHTAEGVLQDGLDVLIGQIERLRIAERMNRGKREKLAEGQIIGHGPMAPYGYKFEGNKKTRELLIEPEEARLVQEIARMYLSGMGLPTVAKQLTAMRIPTPADNGRAVPQRKSALGEWNKGTVHRILTSHVYTGMLYHYRYARKKGKGAVTKKRDKEEWVGVSVPAILTQEVFDAVQKKLREGRSLSKRNSKRFYLLGRRIRCICGYAMIGTTSNSYRVYRCVGSNGSTVGVCKPTPAVNADAIEAVVWQWLEASLTPEALRVGLQEHRNTSEERQRVLQQEWDTLQQQRAEREKELRRARDAYVAGVFDLDELQEQRTKIDTALRSIDEKLIELDAQIRDAGPSGEEADALLAEAAELQQELPHLTDEGRRRLVDRLRLHIVVERHGPKHYTAHVKGLLTIQAVPLSICVAERLSSSQA